MEFIIHEDYAEMIVVSQKHGEFKVKVDLEDIEKCKQYKWNVLKNKLNKGKYVKYYISSGGNGLLLHRFLMNAPKGKVVDHINGDSMDNRKSNLRICKHKENSRNSKDTINNTSGHKGVFWYKRTGKWMAYIKVDYKHITLGYFEDIEKAIEVRKAAEEKYFGEYRSG